MNLDFVARLGLFSQQGEILLIIDGECPILVHIEVNKKSRETRLACFTPLTPVAM